MWYYTGSTCDEKGVKTVYDPTSLSQNRHTSDSRLNTLTFCCYCIISLEEPVTQGFTLANLGFKNFMNDLVIFYTELECCTPTNK